VRAAGSASVAVAALAAAAGLAAAGPRHPGKVVRVERPRATGRTNPRVCQVFPSERRGQCIGRGPAVDEVATVIDDSGVLGSIRVNAASEARDHCGNVITWEYTFDPIGGDPTVSRAYAAIALIEVPLGPRARILPEPGRIEPPGRQTGASTWVAVDTDGDDDADLLQVLFPCDLRGAPSPGQHEAYCAEYWLADGSEWILDRTDIVQTCM